MVNAVEGFGRGEEFIIEKLKETETTSIFSH